MSNLFYNNQKICLISNYFIQHSPFVSICQFQNIWEWKITANNVQCISFKLTLMCTVVYVSFWYLLSTQKLNAKYQRKILLGVSLPDLSNRVQFLYRNNYFLSSGVFSVLIYSQSDHIQYFVCVESTPEECLRLSNLINVFITTCAQSITFHNGLKSNEPVPHTTSIGSGFFPQLLVYLALVLRWFTAMYKDRRSLGQYILLSEFQRGG